ncbi:MAG TPA: GNAT family N-acetyltransferase [Terracidiphilus sp.]|jgi:GNAT superfamily N-acetyltransferase|nr:GNAT family N-acetyltransferase [Terracidiphilus sp.]
MLLRPAEPADALAVARVHVLSWQAAYRGLIDDAYLDSLRPADRAERYDFSHKDPLLPYTQVALDAGRIVGFATTMPSRDDDTFEEGELAALYLEPDFWGRGIGVALIAAARDHLVKSGIRQAVLWVLAGNQRAAHFYEQDGWSAEGTERSQTIWGVTVKEVRYRRILV